MDNFAYIALFIIIGVAFAVVTLFLSWIVRPTYKADETAKGESYECGEIPIGNAWRQFKVGYYIFALIYVVFAVEAAFIFPWAKELTHMKSMGYGIFAFLEMLIFILILVVGLIYAWRKGVLKWD